MADFAFAHPLITTVGVITAGIGLAVIVLCVVFRWLGPGHAVAASSASAGVSLVVAILFSVGLNQFWTSYREYRQRVLSLRAQHLARLQPVLRAEGDRLLSYQRTLRENGLLIGDRNVVRERIWTDDVLAEHLSDHFQSYYAEKERLLGDLLKQSELRLRIADEIEAGLRIPTAVEPYRSDVVSVILNRCLGYGPTNMRLTVSGARYTFERGGGSSTGDAQSTENLAAMQGAVDVVHCARSTYPDCQLFHDEAVRLADDVKRVGTQARLLAEVNVLPGNCSFVDPNLVR